MIPYEGVAAECALCGGDIYAGETYYAIQGENICRDCLGEYAGQVFASCAVKGGAAWARRGSET